MKAIKEWGDLDAKVGGEGGVGGDERGCEASRGL